MIELRAVRSRRFQTEAGSFSGRTTELPFKLTQRKESHGRGVSLLVMGDEPVHSCIFESPAFSLICRTDLLGVEGNSANASPAARIAELYERHGDDFAGRLRGAFAVILYDHRTSLLKAWLDHFAIQTLAYTESQEFLAVATDLRLLLSTAPNPPEIDPAAVQEYLQYSSIPAPRTIYKGYWRLAPGHQLVGDTSFALRQYWNMTYTVGETGRSDSEWAEETLKAVRSAVAHNLTGLSSKDTLGCFLSGGTDSSSVAGLTGEITGQSPRTFSIGFDDPRYNEIRYARIAAARYKADHHEYFVKPQDILAVLQTASDVYDEPFGNSSVIPTYYCARLAAESGMSYLLAGDGGDEVFGGNERYVSDRVFQRYGLIPGTIRRNLIEPAVGLGSSLTGHWLMSRAASYIRRANIPSPDRLFSYSLLSSTPPDELFTADFLKSVQGNHPLAPARRHYSEAPTDDELNRWLYLDLKMIISDNDLRKVTTMSRVAGITVRYPLLEPTLAEFTGSIPSRLKVRKSYLRYIFKKAMAGVLPQEIITKSKHGFGLPYSVWVGEHKQLRDLTFDTLGSTKCRERGYFRRDLLDWLWTRYENEHRRFYGDVLWLFLMLEFWHLARPAHSAKEYHQGIPAPVN